MTIYYIALYVAELKVREVFSGANDVLGIQVNNNYISLPGELFNGSGTTTSSSMNALIHVLFYFSVCRFILF